MLNRFRFSPRAVVGLLVLTAVILTGCGDKQSASWAGVSSGPDGDRVYVAYEKRVVALDAHTGDEIWSYRDKKHEDATFFAIPTVDDSGAVYVGDYEGRLHAIGSDGKQLWLYEPDRDMFLGWFSVEPKDRVIGGVAYDDERIYFGLGSRNVVALDRANGDYLWDFSTEHGVWATPLFVPANEVGAQGVLYVTSLDHHLYALNPETGDSIWDLDLGAAAPDSPLYDAERNRLYIGTFLSEVLAIDLETQAIVDRYSTEGWMWGSPNLVDNTLYFGDLEGYLYAVPLNDDGSFNDNRDWREHVSKDSIRSTPVVVEGVEVMVNDEPVVMDLVIAGSQDRYIYAVDRESGNTIWKEKVSGRALTNLILVPATDENPAEVVVGTSSQDNLLIALDTTNGDRGWHHSY
jgi:outer membrane protein assembly factor BamB